MSEDLSLVFVGFNLFEGVGNCVGSILESREDVLEHLVAHGGVGIHLDEQGLGELGAEGSRGLEVLGGGRGTLLQFVKQSWFMTEK